MTISNKDLFMAILSMDSYNRGYGAGITLPDSPKIGNATIINTGPASDAWVTAGFYAAAYETDYGNVISYRGTNINNGLPAYNDVVNGWAFAAGDFTPS
jgi:hypothetical protein